MNKYDVHLRAYNKQRCRRYLLALPTLSRKLFIPRRDFFLEIEYRAEKKGEYNADKRRGSGMKIRALQSNFSRASYDLAKFAGESDKRDLRGWKTGRSAPSTGVYALEY